MQVSGIITIQMLDQGEEYEGNVETDQREVDEYNVWLLAKFPTIIMQ